MPKLPFPPAIYIESRAELKRIAEQLAAEPLLAVDTESNSLYAYKERVCLIQLSTRQADYIIDPLAIDDLQPLAPLLAADHIEKVFHAAEYDVMCLKRDYGFTFRNLFDTMAAARICGLKAVGLGSLLEDFIGIKMDKSHQLDDWGRRPLSPASLHYAQLDTHYLPQLRDELQSKLKAMGRSEEAYEVFEEICQSPAAVMREFDPDGFWRIGRPHLFNRKELLILRELHNLREEIARERDVPPFKVFTNNVLIALTKSIPTNQDDLKAIHGLSAQQSRRYGRRILQAIRRGRSQRRLPPQPRQDRSDPLITERYIALHSWRKERAIRRGVESDVIISKQTLWELAESDPDSLDALDDIRGMGPWRTTAYGEEILDVLSRCKQLER
jgi:ribonuclease D